MADAGYLTIGKVVKRLQQRYPDLSVSKVRYLEDEGLINPSRTPGGYRLYSQHDINRLETILHLQKTRFLPLQVIKEELERRESGVASQTVGAADLPIGLTQSDDEQTTNRLHPIDRMPEVAGAPVSFVRQLAEVGVIPLKRSPHGRDLVDGHDLALIRSLCECSVRQNHCANQAKADQAHHTFLHSLLPPFCYMNDSELRSSISLCTIILQHPFEITKPFS